MDRKITQIAAIRASKIAVETIFALCDDGTLWQGYVMANGDFTWEQLPPIPENKERFHADNPVA